MKLLTQHDLIEHLNTLLSEFEVQVNYETTGETITSVVVAVTPQFEDKIDGNQSIEACLSYVHVISEVVFVLLTAFNERQPVAQRNQMLGHMKVALFQTIEDRYNSAIDNSNRHLEIVGDVDEPTKH